MRFRAERAPLFGMMEHYGGGDPERRIRRVTDPEMYRKMLSSFGMNEPFIDSVIDRTMPLTPLSQLVYARPLAYEEDISREGRGFYALGNNLETVYTKGNGNAALTRKEWFVRNFIPGFPTRKTPDLFFDNDSVSASDRRIRGALHLVSAGIEFVNASLILAKIAEKQGWKTVEDAIHAGMTVPIVVTEFSQLSSNLNKLTHMDPPQVYGSVTMIVPGDERADRLLHLMNGDIGNPITVAKMFLNKETAKKLKDPDIAATKGRALRQLLMNVGAVYDEDSAHGQNLYTKGFVPQADSRDMRFLGDHKDPWVQAMYIYQELKRNDGLLPPAFPRYDAGISAADVAVTQQKFWKEFLGGIAHPDAIAKLPQLIPTLREQILMASSLLLVQKAQEHNSAGKGKSIQQEWAENAAQRREAMIAMFAGDTRERVREAVDAEINPTVSEKHLAQFKQRVQQDSIGGIQNMLRFLQTGDIKVLQASPGTASLMKVSEILSSHQQPIVKNVLFEMIGTVLYATYHRPYLFQPGDTDPKRFFEDKYLTTTKSFESLFNTALELLNGNHSALSKKSL